ncbi:hypothetical protein NL676_022969 [Syzygium grande]|nr:hypothetical protein NL676_022969 [Syzygium grande]
MGRVDWINTGYSLLRPRPDPFVDPPDPFMAGPTGHHVVTPNCDSYNLDIVQQVADLLLEDKRIFVVFMLLLHMAVRFIFVLVMLRT